MDTFLGIEGSVIGNLVAVEGLEALRSFWGTAPLGLHLELSISSCKKLMITVIAHVVPMHELRFDNNML